MDGAKSVVSRFTVSQFMRGQKKSMAKKVNIKARQEVLQHAWRVAEPGEIDRLVKQAKGDGALQRELRQVKRQLVQAERRAKRAEAKLREREARAARRARAKANTKKYVEPHVDSAGVSTSCTDSPILMDDGSVIAIDAGRRNYSIRPD